MFTVVGCRFTVHGFLNEFCNVGMVFIECLPGDFPMTFITKLRMKLLILSPFSGWLSIAMAVIPSLAKYPPCLAA
jgi:hypothetical protein